MGGWVALAPPALAAAAVLALAAPTASRIQAGQRREGGQRWSRLGGLGGADRDGGRGADGGWVEGGEENKMGATTTEARF